MVNAPMPSAGSRLPGTPEPAEYANVADAAHMVAGDRNDLFADAVVDFLNRVVPPTRPEVR
jgi:hypothetical protein